MPGDTITRAVKRGTGEIEGAAYEEVLYEGTGPAGTLFLVEGMTDNRNRTVAEIRKIFEKHNGVMGGSGAAAWAFDRKGIDHARATSSATEDQLMEIAVGAGADDYSDDGDEWTVYTPPDVLDKVTRRSRSAASPTKSSKLGVHPEEQERRARPRRRGLPEPRRDARRPRRRAERLRGLRHLGRRAPGASRR